MAHKHQDIRFQYSPLEMNQDERDMFRYRARERDSMEKKERERRLREERRVAQRLQDLFS